MWSGGGNGFGLLGFAAMSIWEAQSPRPGQKDWPSVVTVQGKPEDYTDEELFKLVEFSRARTADYDRVFSVRMGANLSVIEKINRGDKSIWLRKQMSWEMGPMYSDTLEDAIKVLMRK